ncbi:bifunctional 4-hydroxy-2-oxoglutarate aldolase/2-dehydro-3-deoxy-phosphogluconate aldolase [Halomonas sp. WWR20]
MTIEQQLPSTRIAELDALCQRVNIIPVIVVERLEDAVPLAQALVEGGLTVLEVTLRTDCALDAIKRMREALPEVSLGAGTVLTPEQYRQAEAAGVDFIVTPGATEALFAHGVQSKIPMLPGVATVSELMLGWQYGYRRFKFFPAEANGGAPALKAFGGPIPEARFCPTGGVTLENAQDYLSLPNVICVGGSWMAPKALIDNGDWDGIRTLARQAVERFPV